MSMYNNAARTAKEMPLQLSYKEELTFCDIAACFSEEEWQLLHKWQKELYDNVMKEINHVINSLGPLIATSVFSLRPKEKDDLSSVDLHYRGRRSSINTSSREPTSTSVAFKGRLHAEDIQDAGEKKSFGSCITDVTSESDVLLKVNEYLKDAWDTDEKMCSAGQNTGDHILSANNICRMKEELESRFMDHSDADVIENSDRSSLGHPDMAPVILFNIKREDECHSMDPLDSKRRENATTNAMSDVTKPIASIDFYEEEEAYPIGLQDHRAEEGFYHLSGYGSMNRKRKENKNLKCHVKAKLYKSVTKKIEANVVQNVTNIDRSRGQIGYEGNQEVRGEPSEQWESDYSQQIHPTIHQVTPSIQTLETYGTCEDVIQNDDVVSRNSNPVHFFRQYTCPKREQIFQNSQTSHRQDHRGKRRYTCTECGKSLSTTSKLVTHERIHTGERPYQCTICGKSFSQKGVLLRHQIMHTGKRAHQCNVCGKCFSRKDQLLRHQKIHTRTLHFQTDLL